MAGKVLIAGGLLALLIAYSLSSSSSASLPNWPLFRFGLFLNSVLTRLLRATTPPPLLIMSEMTGFLVSKSIVLACKFQLADHLRDGALHIDQLAARAHTDPETTDRLVKYLAVKGVFQRVEEKVYANNAVSEYLRKDHPESMWAVVLHLDFMERATAGYEAAVRDKNVIPYQKAFNTTLSVFDYLQLPENKEDNDIFNLAMVEVSRGTLEAILADYPWPAHTPTTLVDVGGGIGHLAAAALRKHPLYRGVVFDTEVHTATAYWRKEYTDVLDRAEFVSGSFFESVPAGGDLYVLKHILHDWNDTDSVAILRTVATAMRATKKQHPEKNPLLLMTEMVYDFPPVPEISADGDMLMLVLRGQERSVEEFERLFKAVGLKKRDVVRLPTRFSIIEAELS